MTVRLVSIIRLAAIVSAVVLTCYGLGLAWISAVHSDSARSVLGAQFSFALFMVPNVLSFAISAWIMRGRWVHIRLSQLVAAGFFFGVSIVALTLAFALLTAPFFQRSALAEVLARVTMVLPGIIAAQLLRAGGKRDAHLSAT